MTLVVISLMHLLVCDYYVEMCFEERFFIYVCTWNISVDAIIGSEFQVVVSCPGWVMGIELWSSVRASCDPYLLSSEVVSYSLFFYFIIHYLENFRLHIDVSLITLDTLFTFSHSSMYYILYEYATKINWSNFVRSGKSFSNIFNFAMLLYRKVFKTFSLNSFEY